MTRSRECRREPRGDLAARDSAGACPRNEAGSLFAAGRQVKEGKNGVKWMRLSCHDFADNQVRLQLFALAYNLGNFLRRLALPRAVKHWSLIPIYIGAAGEADQDLPASGRKAGRCKGGHARPVRDLPDPPASPAGGQVAEVAVPQRLFRAILDRIRRLRPREPVPG